MRGGKAEVRVWLDGEMPKVLASLKALGSGVVHDPRAASLIVGRVAVERLEALAALEAVRDVWPR